MRHVATLVGRPRTLTRAGCRRTSPRRQHASTTSSSPSAASRSTSRDPSRSLPPGALAGQAHVVGTHEPDHVKTFKALLGSAVIKEPSFNFAGVTGNSKAFRGTAVAFEDLATGANKEQAPLIQFREATDDRGRSPAAGPRCRSEGRPSRPAPRVRRHGRVRGRRRRCSSCIRGSVLEPPDRSRRPTSARAEQPSLEARRPARTSAASVNGTGEPVVKADGSAVSGSPTYADVSPTRGAPSGGGSNTRARARMGEEMGEDQRRRARFRRG